MRKQLSERAKSENRLETSILKLLAYCRANDWAGYDPYDALNSKVLPALPFVDSRLPRLVFTQALKRSPFNIRPLLLIPRTKNPKAIALFLSALVKLVRIGLVESEELSSEMVEQLIALRSRGVSHSCWGYSFPWQTRTVLVPAGAPNLVCTAFVGNALLDLHEHRQHKTCLNMAVSAAEYILNQLYWIQGDSLAGFSYPMPNLRNQVPNANLLGAALLCRVYKHTRERKFLGPALRVARHTVEMQRADGSWYYGEAPSQRWIDNFHTGYILCALQSINGDAKTSEFELPIRFGLKYYVSHFFGKDGAPKYFHHHKYPVDIHSVAQSIITLLLLRDFDPANVPLARSVFEWAMNHMWNERGFFYHSIHRLYTNRISYMRWSQAWMLLAMSTLLEFEAEAALKTPAQEESTTVATAC